jgi:hypothetical protein
MIVNKRVCEDTVFKISLSEEEVFMSSTYRELRGIEEGMKALAGKVKGKGIRWHCDNWSACKIVEFGSMKADCHAVAKRINALIRQLDVNFEIVWLSRESEEIRFADRISKDFDFGDYRLSRGDFASLVYVFGEFSADYFALDYSYRMRPFFSRYISGMSAGSDAFAQDWSRGFGYFHPSVGLVPKVLDKAREDGAQGILVVPDWAEIMMAREIRCCEELELVGRWRPLFECPVWFENSTFRGVPSFDVLAFRTHF